MNDTSIADDSQNITETYGVKFSQILKMMALFLLMRG